MVALLGPNGREDHRAHDVERRAPADRRRRALQRRADRSAPQAGRAGMAVVTEERSVFMGMSTINNLRVGCRHDCARALPRARRATRRCRRAALSVVSSRCSRSLVPRPQPTLAPRRRALARPRTDDRRTPVALRARRRRTRARRVARRATHPAPRGRRSRYVMRRGQLVLQGTGAELRRIDEIEAAYLT